MAAPTICSSHHHHHHRRRPDGNLIAAVAVTGLCVIEMKRRATPLERNYYYHLCVHEYVVCSCHNHQKSQLQPQPEPEQKPGQPSGAIRHCHCFPTVRGAARLGLVLFFASCFFYFSPYVVCNFVCECACVCVSAGCTHFHMNAPDLPHSPRREREGKGWEVFCANEAGRGKAHEMTKTAESR